MKKIVKCNCCGRSFRVEECVKVVDPITHYSYQCRDCYSSMGSYSHEVGTFKTEIGKKISITTGFEFELPRSWSQEKIQLTRILGKYGYTPTYDCTAGIEWKSPIYRNLNGIAKLLYSVMENQGLSLARDRSVGTHVNVWSEELSSRDWKRIQNYYEIIFRPLYETIMQDENHDKLFGRKANNWCSGFGLYHECLINMQNDKIENPRIELRICKYHDNKQFMNCLRFSNDFMKTILVNFSRNYMTDNKAAEMGKDASYATQHNQHKAEITAQKLVKVYNKYMQKALEL